MGDAAAGGDDGGDACEHDKENGTHQNCSFPSFAAQP
jgi:hypothetical protein